MGTTTHVSAGRRRRQRLRRTLLVTTLLVASAATAGYAAWHGDDADPTSAADRADAGPGRWWLRVGHQAQACRGHHPPARRELEKPVLPRVLPPVVTDRIPAPTTSLALSAAVPGTTNMQAPAAAAFKRAFADARAAGLAPEIRSAWRSEQWQQILFDRAVTKYGSRAEASKWVLSPAKSAHVKGYAIDVHPQSVASWLRSTAPPTGCAAPTTTSGGTSSTSPPRPARPASRPPPAD